MSMSWDHKCEKCGKEFSNFDPRDPLCYDCTEVMELQAFDDDVVFKCTNFGGMGMERIQAKFLKQIKFRYGDYKKIPVNNREFKMVLEQDEIAILEQNMGKQLSILYRDRG